jgi:hypothetical protein
MSKAKTELKCRCDALACQLISQGTNLTNVHTEVELANSRNTVIELTKQFLARFPEKPDTGIAGDDVERSG